MFYGADLRFIVVVLDSLAWRIPDDFLQPLYVAIKSFFFGFTLPLFPRPVFTRKYDYYQQ